MSFESNMKRLEEISARLDSSETDLSTALALFDEAVEVLRAAATELRQAEGKVQMLVDKIDGSFDLTDLRT